MVRNMPVIRHQNKNQAFVSGFYFGIVDGAPTASHSIVIAKDY